MVYTVYADETLFLNTIINYFLFLSSLRLARLPIRRARVLLSAFLASLYALLALLPALAFFYILPFKLLFALLFSLLAAGSGRRRLLVWALFLAFSLLYGGVVTAFTLVWHASMPLHYSGTVFVPASLRTAAVFSAGIYYFVALFFKNLLPARKSEVVSYEIALNGKSVSLQLLSDTGSALFDPVSGLSVPIVSKKALEPLFSPADFLLLSALSPTEAVTALHSSGAFFGLLPVTTASESALLLTFRADRLTRGGHSIPGALVAVAETDFAPGCGFAGVIAPD